jgi:hypothetical protein
MTYGLVIWVFDLHGITMETHNAPMALDLCQAVANLLNYFSTWPQAFAVCEVIPDPLV